MKPLPESLRKNGFTYTQVHREGKVCIYEQGVTKNLKYFEVFIVKIRPPTIFKGTQIEEREVFPCDEDFGKTAWSLRTLEDANIKFKILVEKQSNTNKIKILNQ